MATSSVKDKREEHKYQCIKCQFEWPNFAGPQECPMCKSNYVKWLTYKEETVEKEEMT